jgi:hypothetical protein
MIILRLTVQNRYCPDMELFGSPRAGERPDYSGFKLVEVSPQSAHKAG